VRAAEELMWAGRQHMTGSRRVWLFSGRPDHVGSGSMPPVRYWLGRPVSALLCRRRAHKQGTALPPWTDLRTGHQASDFDPL